MCCSAIASPGTSPCVAADAAPSTTAPIAAPMAAAIPRDIIRHLRGYRGGRRILPLWNAHRKDTFRQRGHRLPAVSVCDLPPFRGRKLPRRRDAHLASESFLRLPGPDERREAVRHALDLVPEGGDLRPIGAAQILQVRGVADHF